MNCSACGPLKIERSEELVWLFTSDDLVSYLRDQAEKHQKNNIGHTVTVELKESQPETNTIQLINSCKKGD